MKLKHSAVATHAATLITFGSLTGGANAALITVNGLNTQRIDITYSSFPDFTWEFINDSFGGSYIFATGLGYTSQEASFTLGGPPAQTFSSTTGLNLNELESNAYTFWNASSGFSEGLPGNGIYYVSGGFNTNANSSFTTAQLAANSHLVMKVQVSEIFSENRFLGYVYDDGQQAVDFTTAVSLLSVPEPSSALLLGLGSLGIIMRRRRVA